MPKPKVNAPHNFIFIWRQRWIQVGNRYGTPRYRAVRSLIAVK